MPDASSVANYLLKLSAQFEILRQLVAQREAERCRERQGEAELAQGEAELAQREAELAQREAELAQGEAELAQREAELAQREGRTGVENGAPGRPTEGVPPL